MEHIATIKTNLLAAAHVCTEPKNAARPIVQRVHLVPARSGDRLNVYGTQGHYMYIGQQPQVEDNQTTKPVSIRIVSRLPAKFKKSETVEIVDIGGGKLLLTANNGETVTGERYDFDHSEALERVTADAISSYQHQDEEPAQYAPASIKTISEAIKAHTGRREATPHIHQRGERAALVEFEADDDGLIVLMPYRTKPNGCPAATAWLASDKPKQEEAQAA